MKFALSRAKKAKLAELAAADGATVAEWCRSAVLERMERSAKPAKRRRARP